MPVAVEPLRDARGRAPPWRRRRPRRPSRRPVARGRRSPRIGSPLPFWPGRCATRPQRCALLPEVDRAATLPGPTGSWTPSSSVWPVAARRPPATPMRGPPGWPARNVASRSRRTRRPGCLAGCGAGDHRDRARRPPPRRAAGDHPRRSRAAAQRAREAWVDARERWVELRAARLDGMAAELAAQLTEGTDCPVCGAVEHPRLATHEGPVVTADDEQRARDAVDVPRASRQPPSRSPRSRSGSWRRCGPGR